MNKKSFIKKTIKKKTRIKNACILAASTVQLGK